MAYDNLVKDSRMCYIALGIRDRRKMGITDAICYFYSMLCVKGTLQDIMDSNSMSEWSNTGMGLFSGILEI